jgi:DNA-binding transcriptional MerR regulator
MAALYATGAFAEQLGISKASLQHYITILEEHGYEVSRNSRKHRQFSDDDLMLLRAFLTLNKNRGLKLKEAAQTVTQPDFKPMEVLQHEIIPASYQVSQFEDLSNSMQLLATHVYGIEQQNMQLLTLIEEQRTQNELLIEQNQVLKQQFGVMMQHLLEQANEPSAVQQRQLDRVEQQNSAIMSVLNKLNVAQHEQSVSPQQEPEKKAKGLFGKLLK